MFAVFALSACGGSKQVAKVNTADAPDSVPVGQKIPDTPSVPVGGKIPDTQSVPVGEKIPDTESVPVGAKIPGAESSDDPVRAQWLKDQALIQAYIAKYNGLNMQFTPSGIYYEVTRQGNGKFPKAKNKVNVRYKGSLLNGSVFDENQAGIEFFLTQVIQGWTEGMQLVDEGGSITMLIPSYLAYGPKTVGNIIPANSVLRFDVDLVAIK